MSAGENGHADAPKKIDEWGISEERLSSIQTPESEESAAPAHEWVPVADQPPETPSGAVYDSDETLDRLLCAIGDTEIARRLRGLTPADGDQAHAPAHAEPLKSPLPADAVNVEPPSAVAQAVPARAETSETPIPAAEGKAEPPKTSLPAAEAKVAPPTAVAQAASAHAERPKAPISAVPRAEPFAGVGQAAPAAHAVGTFIVQASASAPLMPPATAPHLPHPAHPRVSAAPGMIEAGDWVAIPRVSSPPKRVDEAELARVAVHESAPAVATPRPGAPARDRSQKTAILLSTILVWCGGAIKRAGAKLAPMAKSMGRAFWRFLVRFTKRAVAEAEAILESTDFAESRRSSGLKDSARATQSAPDTEGAGHARPQPKTRLRRWLDPRRGLRLAKPPAVAYCWTADTPDPVEIADIGPGGVRLLTEARWPCGGVFSMTLQRTDRTSETPDSWIVVDFMVVRLCGDGVAGSFIPSTHGLSRVIPSRAENCADEKTLRRFVRDLAEAGGG